MNKQKSTNQDLNHCDNTNALLNVISSERRAVCIKTMLPHLKEGKVYQVVEELCHMFYIVADDGEVRAYNKTRFKEESPPQQVG